MRKCHVFGGSVLALAMVFSASTAQSQQPEQPKQQQPKSAPQPAPTPAKKPIADLATARLVSARNVLVTRDRGSHIPYETISSTLDGWGRFTMVDTADKADLVITVGTTGGDSGVSVSGDAIPSALTGAPERSTGSRMDFSDSEITMTVYDARNKRILWTAVQTAKSSMKKNERENKLVEAAEKLASKFHDRLEPPPPPRKDED